MTANLNDLLIHQKELENFIDGITLQIPIDMYRGVILKNKKSLFSVVVTEVFTFIVVLILVMPITLIGIKSRGKIPQELTEINQLLLILLALCLGLMLLINIYLWKKSQKLKSLAVLVDKTEQYNQLIHSIKLVEQLDSVNSFNGQENWESQNQELLNTLRVTKNSLIQAFTVEQIIRKHKGIISSQYELWTNIETNLTALMTFEFEHSTSNYRELLQDAVQIGMTVHREVKKLRNS